MITFDDMLKFAHCLLGADIPYQQHARYILQKMYIAQQYLKQTGRLHPEYGNGTLSDLCDKAESCKGGFNNPLFCHAFAIACTALAKFHNVSCTSFSNETL